MAAATEKALELRRRMVGHYYAWTPLVADLTLYLRVPNVDIFEKEEWLAEEDIEVIHVCDPQAYLDAVDAIDSHASLTSIGRCRDGKCIKCDADVDFSVHWDDDGKVSSVLRTQLTGNSDEPNTAPQG